MSDMTAVLGEALEGRSKRRKIQRIVMQNLAIKLFLGVDNTNGIFWVSKLRCCVCLATRTIHIINGNNVASLSSYFGGINTSIRRCFKLIHRCCLIYGLYVRVYLCIMCTSAKFSYFFFLDFSLFETYI